MAIKGFFSSDQLASRRSLPSTAARCGECGLYKTCQSPKMPWSGEGRKGILFVAEAPGKEEDKKNTQLVGDAGKLLREVCSDCGISLDRDCWKTNAIICRPPKNKTPDEKKIQACRPHLLNTIRELNPHTVILLGITSVKSLIGYIWKDTVGAMGRWVGWNIPCQDLNIWICPTYHPSYLLRDNRNTALRFWFTKHLESFFEHEGRPWEKVPNWKEDVICEYNPNEAAKRIEAITGLNGTITFDYETNCIKPETPGARIYSCSICWNNDKQPPVTIAYPWHGKAIEATKKLLLSPVPKIAANAKYEDRWTRRHLGIEVKNWQFDTMVASHVEDNRSSITGLKFQSFVRFGMHSYNDHVEPFLTKVNKIGINDIHKIGMRDLLLYNGLDSLLEDKLARLQMKELM